MTFYRYELFKITLNFVNTIIFAKFASCKEYPFDDKSNTSY